MKRIVLILMTVVLLGLVSGQAMAGSAPAENNSVSNTTSVTMDAVHWDIQAKQHEFVSYKGQSALFLGEGLAMVKGLDNFTNGVVEFDIAIPEERGFSGVVWRVQDKKNYEEFYLRHHQSGNEDANQYSPVFNGLAGWQLYYSGDGFGFPSSYSYGEWMHVKLILSGPELEVYLEDMETPIIYIVEQRRPVTPGGLGLRSQISVPAHFANFSYTPMNNPPMKRKAKEASVLPGPAAQWRENAKRLRAVAEAASPGAIMNWEVSEPIDYSLLADVNKLNTTPIKWTPMKADETGLLDLSQVSGVGEFLEKNGRVVVLCRAVVHSNKEQTKRMELGFSDEVLFFINGKPVYEGSDRYSSRDYRFLGTLGYYDAVFLPLKPGKNRLLFAVGEYFGGFGVKARFPNTQEMKVNLEK